MNFARALLRLFGLLFCFAPAMLFAATITVTTNGDGAGACVGQSCPTLRAALSKATSGDTITFAAAIDGQTILLASPNYDVATANPQEFGASKFFITGKTVTIDGSGHGITIARDPAQAAFRLFDIDSNATVTLRGLTLRNGLARAGNSGTGGGALGAGGAIFNQGILTIDACTFAGNLAQGGNAGVGSASGGAGVGADASGTDGGGPNGAAAGRGGGFGGGGGQAANGGFGGGGGGTGNGGFGGGGGSSGAAGFGGGSGNTSGGGGAGMGGAIFNDAGTVTLTNATLYKNSAVGGAGGNATSGKGSGYGAAIFNYAGTLSLSFVTLAANSTSAGGTGNAGNADAGAIESYGDANCGLTDGNTCASGDAQLTLVNSIAARSAGSAHDVVVDNSAGVSSSSGGGNLIMAQAAFGGTFISSDPKLGALSPYAGGSAPATLPIAAASPAYNAAASCNDARNQAVASDERGKARPQSGTCDIGAFEFDNDYIFSNSLE